MDKKIIIQCRHHEWNKSVAGGSHVYIRKTREGYITRYRIDRLTITVIVVIAYRTERK